MTDGNGLGTPKRKARECTQSFQKSIVKVYASNYLGMLILSNFKVYSSSKDLWTLVVGITWEQQNPEKNIPDIFLLQSWEAKYQAWAKNDTQISPEDLWNWPSQVDPMVR